MTVSKYYQMILDTVQGRTDELRLLPPERLDWAGPGALLQLYRKTSGSNRTEFIHAIGQVIEDHPARPAAIAQLVLLASSLDLAELEPQVRKLQAKPVAFQEPLRSAILNFLAFRQLNTPPQAVEPRRTANGKQSKDRNARSATALSPESTKDKHSSC